MILTTGQRILGGLWGAVVGDALGVPVEFKSRGELKKGPVTDMIGFGTHNQPPGTWSDDSSLMLCLAEVLMDGFDTVRLGCLFIQWLRDAYMTPHGEVFDVGIATRQSINKIASGIAPEAAGGTHEHSNGNGSLMRILPVALMFYSEAPGKMLGYAHRASSLTHAHPRSQMACGYYCLVAAEIIKGAELYDALKYAAANFRENYNKAPFINEMTHFKRVLSMEIKDLPVQNVLSSGYVIHTLEASIWCLLNSGSYRETVLKAVNLGDDTDTTGIVAGGLAGAFYGADSVPGDWLNRVARHMELKALFKKFSDVAVKGSVS